MLPLLLARKLLFREKASKPESPPWRGEGVVHGETAKRQLAWTSPETWMAFLGIMIGFTWAGVVFYMIRQRSLVRLKALELQEKELELARIRLEERRAKE